MQNYAGYGSYYAESLSSLQANYPGLKYQLSKTGLSIYTQDRYPNRIPIDMMGEQTARRFFFLSTKMVLKQVFSL